MNNDFPEASVAPPVGLRCLHQQFEQIAAQCPERIALTCGDETLTYDSLNRRANRIAHALIATGVRPDTFAGLCVDREPDLVAGILGILKAGAAYVPIDLSYPADRLSFMLKDAEAPVLVSQTHLASALPGYQGQTLFLDSADALAGFPDTNPDLPSTLEQLAHVIYTSGSTGLPKGCAVTHRSVARLLQALEPQFAMGPDDVWTLFHSTAFDFSVWEVWGALLYGARLVVVPYCVSRSPADFYNLLVREQVTMLNQTPSAFRQLIQAEEQSGSTAPLALRHIMLGGEAIDVHTLLPWYQRHGRAVKVHNMYGPTETTVFATTGEIDWDHPDAPCNIGKPLPGTTITFHNEQRQAVAPGTPGEIIISGPGVARGYLHRDDLNSARFLPDPNSGNPDARCYASGDLGRLLPDGTIEYMGRIDQQIKLHGFRIELGEIESRLLTWPGIREAAVLLREDKPSDPRLVAYLISPASTPNLEALRAHLGIHLPHYMVPAAFVVLERFPITTNGKLDRRALPAPAKSRLTATSAEFIAPRTPVEQAIASVWADILGLDQVSAGDHFFDLGGSSVLMVRVGPALREKLNRPVKVTDLFTYPTVAALAAHLTAAPASPIVHEVLESATELDSIAIVGMAGRFPGANDLDAFWENLVANRDVVTRFTPDQIAAHEPKDDPAYVPSRGIIDKPEWWDASFFGTSPREAESIDPQQRVFMEEAWHALEHAACDPSRFPGLIGVYAGLSNNSYYGPKVEFNRDLRTALGGETIMLGNEKDYLATRTAWKLGLRGPALNIYTACSTSLVAITQAVQALQTGACDLALAGGVTIKFPQERGYLYREGSMFSKDGLCRSFDADAAGTVFSNGVGVVALKRTREALRDGDTIWAVIKAAALNNDGSSRVSFTAPNPAGQAEVIRRALDLAKVSPDTIDYVEAHGTATPLGDPIEVAGLTEAFRHSTQRTGYCALGSLKSNLGHLDVTAGVAGLIKTALSLKHALLPATLHYQKPNPALSLGDSPFYIVSQNMPWPQNGHPRRAGLSAFGLGGTNAHVILEEAPALPASGPSGPDQMLVLSAKSPEALTEMAAQLAAWFEQHPDINLADAAATLQTGRQAFSHRLALTASSPAEAALALRQPLQPIHQTQRQVPLAFIFPGQGSQHIRMAAGLYAGAPVFTEVLDQCCDLLTPHLGLDLRTLLFPDISAEAAATAQLGETRYTQPALFAVEYALASQLIAWGLEPAIMLGHSIGEYTAACLANVFSLADAAALVATRGRLMWSCAPGAMLAVRAPLDQVEALLPGNISIAALNAPALTVVSGPSEAIDALASQLDRAGISARRLHTSHAFHSAMMEPVLEDFRRAVAAISLRAPTRPYISNLTGLVITAAQATDPDYYVQHLRSPVRFSEAITTLLANGPCAILECGPGQALTPLIKQHPSAATATIITPALPPAKEAGAADQRFFHTALTKLWLGGVELPWQNLTIGRRQRLPLPLYPFQRQRYCPDFELPADWERDSMSNLMAPAGFLSAPALLAAPASQVAASPAAELAPPAADALPRLTRLINAARTELTRISGIDLKGAPLNTSFFDLGFDSLSLTQSSLNLKKLFNLPLSMRQLSEELGNLEALGQYLDTTLPPEAFPPPVTRPDGHPHSSASQDANATAQNWTVKVQHQKAGGHGNVSFGPFRPLQTNKDGTLTPQQKSHLDELLASYIAKHRKSRDYTQKHRAHFADPRAVSGFNHLWKEGVFPVVTNRSKGAYLWDIDGNKFVDITLGFGPAFLGHSPDFVVEAVKKQLDLGFEIGPTHELAGEVAEMLLEFTGMDRIGFCNTGSEAVMAALRMARTVTGRDRVVTFAGDYHGTFDEVLIKPAVVDGELRTVPIAPGIPENIGANILVLDYGNPESLDIIRQHAHEIAAVLVESVRSRDPGLQPADFLHELRAITAASGTALVFDEIVTGFRSHPNGAQGWFGIEADIATYGKVVGGGIPLGLVAGKRQFMDALDGGHWQFGDDSGPEVGVTFFAGTFVRHPLALAAAKAVLLHLKEQGPALQESLTQKTTSLVAQLNTIAAEAGVPLHIGQFTSFFYPTFAPALKYTEPFFHHMRLRGIHVWSARPWFLSTVHTEADIAAIVTAFRESVQAMQDGGFFPAAGPIPGSQAPVTPAQQEIFLASHYHPDSAAACHESMALRLTGDVSASDLERALAMLVRRHDALCAVVSDDGSRLIFIRPPVIPVPITDLSGSPEEAFQELWDEEFAAPFDLSTGPLLRARLVRFAPGEQTLLLSAHHMVCDGWSFGLLATELTWALQTIAGHNPPALPPADDFADYARSLQTQRESGAFHADRDYWLARYAALPAPLILPCDESRPAEPSTLTAPATTRLCADLSAKLKVFCRTHRLTPYHVLLGTWQILLHRLSGSQDFTLGVPVAGQIAAGLPQLCGHAVQFLPLRAKLNPDTSALALLKQVKDDMLKAQEHQNFTLGELLEQLPDLSGESRRNFAATAFSLEPMMPASTAGGLTVEPQLGYKRRSFFELTLYAYQDAEDYLLLCAYRKELYLPGTVDRWLVHYATLLADLLESPDTSISAMPMLDQAGRRQILETFNHHEGPPCPAVTVHELVEAEARLHPDAPALVLGRTTLSYQELNARANQVAHGLKAAGIGAGTIVPVFIGRSVELIISLLGILKAGASYLPLDPNYPIDRIRFLLEDCGQSVILTFGPTPPLLPGRALELTNLMAGQPDHNPNVPVTPDQPAYLIYTSGSTGQPKGASIPHRGIVRLVRETGYATLDRTRTHLLASAVSFDASTFEIWGALCNGARLAILPAGDFSLTGLSAALRRHKVTTLWLTAGLFQLMVDEHLQDLHQVQEILTGGDVVSLPHLRNAMAAFPGIRFINGYGPTENTTFSACHTIRPGDLQRSSLPIGRPIAHSTAYVLDANRQPQPIGVPGELYVGGAGLADGYFKQPELTAQSFVPHPFSAEPGARLYRTGDLVRWLPDGVLEFLGRADKQIKIRGFRIEPGEVESQLSAYPGVQQICVTATGDDAGSRKLLAYVVASPDTVISIADFRSWAAGQVPSWMVPSHFVVLDKLPVTPNGKIDYRALPAPETPALTAGQNHELTETEQRLATLWCEVLGSPSHTAEDDFFAFGGTSLQGLKLFSSIQREFKVALPLSTIFRASILGKLASLIDSARLEPFGPTGSPLVCVDPLGDAPPLFCIHGGDGGALFYSRLFDNLGQQRPIYTLEAPALIDLKIPIVYHPVEQIAAEYLDLILEVHTNGPCVLTGFSYGGLVAWEIARQMVALGHEAPVVVLLDTCNPEAACELLTISRRSAVAWQKQAGKSLLARLSGLNQRIGSRLKALAGFDSNLSEANRLLASGESSKDPTIRQLQLLQVHTMAMEAYQPGPFPGVVTLIRTDTPDDKFTLPDDYGWTTLAGDFRIRWVTGGHLELFDEPYVGKLAETFGRVLTESMDYDLPPDEDWPEALHASET
jgi:amino acid adenylation domain-containing protein